MGHKTQATSSEGTVYLSVVSVKLQELGKTSITTYALLDSRSQSTLVLADVASNLRLQKNDNKVMISTINNPGASTKAKETSLRVENK